MFHWQQVHMQTATGLTHRLQTMMMTTTAMRKTKPAAADPMMSGSFSWMLVLYSSIETRNTCINTVPCTHTYTHTPSRIHTLSQAETYGRASERLHMEGAMGDRQTYGWANQWASWHLDWLHRPLSKAHWMCSDAADMDKSSGRKCVKWGQRACLGETQTDPAAKSRNSATERVHRGRARAFSSTWHTIYDTWLHRFILIVSPQFYLCLNSLNVSSPVYRVI